MPRHTPFHPRTAALCHSYAWKEWAGYVAVSNYDRHSEREYFAFRHTAGLIDVTPLYKYDVTGPDAAAFLAHVWTRDVTKMPNWFGTRSSACSVKSLSATAVLPVARIEPRPPLALISAGPQ